MPPPFRLRFTDRAAADLAELKRDPGRAKRFKAVQKTLGLLETNPRHPGLQTHEYTSLKGAGGEKVNEGRDVEVMVAGPIELDGL